MASSARGAFIVIEGLDRSGKSTQTELLTETLRQSGRSVELLKFPDRTTHIGKMIDAYLRSESELDDQAIHLLFSANRWELSSKITSLLRSGKIIICDRYAFSGVAFSTAKALQEARAEGAPLSYTWCKTPDTGLPAPDITLFLDISPEKARERGGYGEERYEKEDLQRRVRTVFEKIGQEMGSAWVKIDAGSEREVVTQAILQAVRPVTERQLGESIGSLWL